ncbi:uncharacterized protein PITG_19473 [Phytophthora infestans T30-4]|uniref:Uncharacterized protein n=1 Tax=Phytophthora infestans (strain T30-4) TaxID=403677 RepID=D0P056_PHYIT|nr:uncharacterized protein PITG_19473 [Phytophthora infestans T30-4]EEY70222.1 conserved hypothetical protein [Phytophthora infestans T30-4]|eukprot:XP_002997017.1 conserved hypothetical protein [Phytophthora infestans T30-4]
MTINPPKCAVNMEQRLAALRRDQEIDGLRVYLIKYNLFPRNRDPHNSPIRLEELKELVKHWKLHRQRGFWRDHPDKDDLVRALLQHIKSEAANKKRRQEAQDKYRSKTISGADDGSPGKHRDFSTFFGGNANAHSSGDEAENDDDDREQSVAVAKKKKCGGDLFYQRGDYDEGLIYLSRIDRSRFQSESHNPCQDLLTTSASAPTPVDRLLLTTPDASSKPKSVSATSANDKEGERAMNQMPSVLVSPLLSGSVNTAHLTKDTKLKSVEGLYSISYHKGYEAQLLREGALATLSSVLKLDDPIIRLYSAAAILNLTHYTPAPPSPLPTPVKKNQSQPSSSCLLPTAPPQATRDLYSKMTDEGVIAALLDLVHTPHPTVKALCARALLRFTVDESHHFAMVHEGVVAALSQIMAAVTTTTASPLAAPNDVKLFCVLALVNLSDVPRAVTCDALLNSIIVLARQGDTATRRVCAQALLNLSILPTTRGVVVDEGAIAALEVLTAVAMRPLQLSQLEVVTCTLCNLAAVKNNQDALTKNSALTILSDIILSVGAELRRVQTAAKTVADSAQDEAVASSLLISIRKNCVNSIAMLCCNPKLQVRVRNTGFVPKLLNILRGADDQEDDYSDDEDHVFSRGIDPETEKFVVVALANLALDDRCRPTLVQDGVVPLFLGLLRAPELPGTYTEGVADNQDDKRAAALLLKLDCVTALSNLLLHPANFQALVDAGVVPAFLDLIRSEDTSASSSSKEIQKACVYAMLGLAKDPGVKTRLAEATQKRLDDEDSNDQVGAIPTMLAFASRNLSNAELCGVCISFLHHLSSRAVNHELLFYEGAVGLVVRVLKKPSTAEAPATIYALWLDCLATLAHLASYEAKRCSLLDDGVLEAIQHFLIVSAADQRPRDAVTDRSIIKAQYAASQIVYKLHELCSGISVSAGAGPVDAPAFFACLLLLATQSASKNSRLSKSTVALQHRTARRTALTIAKVALALPQGLRRLAEHADIPPALNMVMRTGIHEAQVCAAVALCNLAAERPAPATGKPLSRVWRDATVDDFIVITLLRVNSPQTKGICAKALFNLLTHEDARDQLMRDGVLYALLKLARLENDSIRDLALRALYNISLDAKKTAQLLEMELVRILAKMYQADLNKTMKRLMIGIFSNLSSASCALNDKNAATNDEGEEKSVEGVVATTKTVELQMLQEGLLSVLKNLAKVRDPEMKLYVANVLYNLSCAVESRVVEILAQDESNVLGILMAELKSESKDVRKYAAKTLANLSVSSVAVQIMTNDAACAVVSVINDTMKGGKTKTGSTPTGSGASSSLSVCVETNCACVFFLRNLFSLELNQRKFIACNGFPTLAALLTSPAMASEAPTLRVATDMICSLAKLNAESGKPREMSYEERLVRDGVVRALVAMGKGAMDGSTTRAEENAACMNIVTSLSSLSGHPQCHDAMLRDGALDALAVLCVTNPSDSRTPFKGLVGVRGEAFALHCMVVIRNLSRQEPSPPPSGPPSMDSEAGNGGRASKAEDVRSQRLTSQPSLVPIVLALSQSTSPQTREHVVVSLYNLARLRRSKRQMIKNDAVKVLLRLGTSAITPFKRHVCSLALQALATHVPPPAPAQSNCPDPTATTVDAAANAAEWDDPHVDKVVQEGIVAAIAALADSHQHDLLVSVSTNLYVITTPPPAVMESITLLRTTNRAIEQRGAPPDWTKVLITDLISWPEIEMGTSRTTAIRVESNLALGALSPGLQEEDHGEDPYSDASDDESRRKGSQGKSSGKLSSPSSSKKQSQLGHNSNLAPPRTCSSDAVLGSFQMLADPKPEKVRVNVEFELAGRRAVTSSPAIASASSNDELPKLRPETAPEGLTEDTSRLGGRLQLTRTQARQDAAYRRLTSNGIYRGNTPESPIKSSAAITKRRSHQLEPLSTPN